jgi:two-component system, cell cycle sensor histidine kinase and response regulator CckA
MSDSNRDREEKSRALLAAGDRRMALLLEHSQRLMAERDPVALLRHVASAARDITEAAIAGVGIVSDNGTRFEDLVSVGLDEKAVADLKRLLALDHQNPGRRVVQTREIVAGTNPGGDPLTICLPASHPPVHSFLFVPIASPSRVYGWLALIEKVGAPAFSDVDTQLATTFGAQAGIVYENARLMSQLRAQAEELRAQEEQTDFAMSAARVGVAYRDLGTSWIVVSKSIARILGLPPDVRGISQDEIYERMHADDRTRVRAAVEKAVRDISDFGLEFRFVLPEGVRWFHFDGRVDSNDRGEPARVVGVLSDITDRRSLELQFRQAQKMEAVGQLAGGVAHDFNNLLTAIVGYGSFALDWATAPEQRRDLEEIIKAAGRASALTKQLLSFSRRNVMETVSIDLNLLIVDMVTMLRRVIGEDIDLTMALAAERSVVRGDRSQLEQVVMNLVLNARDAIDGGGTIQIETGTVTIDESDATHRPGLKAGSYVTLTVSDTGCGMSDDTRARLFEPFFTTKPRGQGTGLGLATVYGIIVQSGGAIHVESEPEHGSAFTVYLPDETSPVLVTDRHVDSQRASGSASVLLVEDEQAVRELVRIILERAGYAVVDAANPEEAETLFDAMASVDLLLTDVVMPGRSGFDLFHRLLQKQPSLRVLFISGYTDYAMFDSTVVEPDLAFLEKPFSAEGLVRKVQEVLSQ